VVSAYDTRSPIDVIDDADVGFDPQRFTLAEIGMKARLSRHDWLAALSLVGVTALGGYMVVAAILDPEPTSKLGLLVLAGTTLALSGSFGAVRVLTHLKPPTVTIASGRSKIEIRW
jgi:hypothetical protein